MNFCRLTTFLSISARCFSIEKFPRRRKHFSGQLSVNYTCRRVPVNLMFVKDKDKPEDRQGTVCKIKCCDCQASYIGETGRNLSPRLTEHKRATRNGDVNNHIAEHHLQTKHQPAPYKRLIDEIKQN